MEKYKTAERSIITTYRASIWKRFIAAVNEFKLIEDGDKIAVCMSGGKDSMLLAKCMQELKRHGKNNFEAVFLVMDPGYNDINRQTIENNAKLLNVPVEIFTSDIFNVVAKAGGSPCYLCARMRRGHLYGKAKELGCNKIALGHHFDDVAETILMSMFFTGQYRTMMPKLKSKNFEGMELIRPLYYVEEADIINWRNLNDLEFIQCACRFTENCSVCDNGGGGSKRQEMKYLLKQLRRDNPRTAQNIVNSAKNVNLDAILGYKDAGGYHGFLDEYGKAYDETDDGADE
ncbi:MAG: tRNA 2-thiocytidine biosynthesis protein TtcA [Clostridiaceae bacterium]|jgi:tRNA(Ile)-lysidine synthase TilS/MesJ|nr:tRNA 2-thiocytidine biosynthesis protein TtcA [Clostridiaceae bacterium]